MDDSGTITLLVNDDGRGKFPKRPWGVHIIESDGLIGGASFGATVREALHNLADEYRWDDDEKKEVSE
jgi:hypothetical protein